MTSGHDKLVLDHFEDLADGRCREIGERDSIRSVLIQDAVKDQALYDCSLLC